jgi:hypothetical protein
MTCHEELFTSRFSVLAIDDAADRESASEVEKAIASRRFERALDHGGSQDPFRQPEYGEEGLV